MLSLNKLAITLIIMLIHVFTGCSLSDDNTKKVRKEHSEILIESITNKDAERLKPLFCEAVRESNGFDDQLNCMLDYINGDIQNFDKLTVATDGETWDEGECIRSDCSYNIDFSTSTDNYRIEVSENFIIADHCEYEGITFISIHHMDENNNYITDDYFLVGDTNI